jgi:hypothetical protein
MVVLLSSAHVGLLEKEEKQKKTFVAASAKKKMGRHNTHHHTQKAGSGKLIRIKGFNAEPEEGAQGEDGAGAAAAKFPVRFVPFTLKDA